MITQYNRGSSYSSSKEKELPVVLELEGCWLKTKDRSGARVPMSKAPNLHSSLQVQQARKRMG